MSEDIYCEIRCPKQTYIPKYKKHLTCHNLHTKVSPGSKGIGFCWLKDPSTNLRHGEFYYEVDANYIPPPKRTIKVQKP